MELIKGQLYQVKLTSGKWITAEFVETIVNNPIPSVMLGRVTRRKTTRYQFKNLSSGREVRIKSLQKIKLCQTTS